MKDNLTQTILTVAVTLIVAYLLWGRGDHRINAPGKGVSIQQQVDSAVAKATSDLKEQMATEQKRVTELNDIKEMVVKATTEIKELIPQDNSGLVQDKLSELQDQIKDLNVKLEDSCGCPKKVTPSSKCGCPQSNSVPAQRKVVEVKKVQEKVIVCEEKVTYIDCVAERLTKWDENCTKTPEPEVKTAIWEKTTKNKESSASIIEIKETKHAMCLAPREFYREQCRKQNCQ